MLRRARTRRMRTTWARLKKHVSDVAKRRREVATPHAPAITPPGAMAFTRTPRCAYSSAADRVSCDTAALETSYATPWSMGWDPEIWHLSASSGSSTHVRDVDDCSLAVLAEEILEEDLHSCGGVSASGTSARTAPRPATTHRGTRRAHSRRTRRPSPAVGARRAPRRGARWPR